MNNRIIIQVVMQAHSEDVRELRYENAVLQKQVEDSKTKIEELEAKVNLLLQQLQKPSASSETISATSSSNLSIFKGALLMKSS